MILGIYGSGGAGRTIRELADAAGKWDEIIFIDDTVSPDEYKGLKRMPYEAARNSYSHDDFEIVIAVGEPEYKEKLYHRILSDGYDLTNVIHPDAIISPTSKIGKGVVVFPGTFVSADACIGNNVTLQQYVVIGHDTIIHDHTQISAFSAIAGRCDIGEKVYIGLHVAIKEKTRVGTMSLIGMGAMVTEDVPELVTVFGNPAKIVMKRTVDSKVFS